MPPNQPKSAGIAFHDDATPTLVDGTYTITVTTAWQAGTGTTDLNVPDDVRHVVVSGPRFQLPPNAVTATSPPSGSTGILVGTVPTVTLGRSTLPWERDGAGGSTAGSTAGSPWLALLLLGPDDQHTITEAGATPTGTPPLQFAVGAAAYCAFRNDASGVDVATVPCAALSLDGALLARLLTTPDERRLLCHVRSATAGAAASAGPDDDVPPACVVANRVVTVPGRHEVCLVSLEHRDYLTTTNLHQGAAVPLLLLHHWSFVATEGGDPAHPVARPFAELVKAVAANTQLIGISRAAPPTVTAVDRGGHTAAVGYHGPLVAEAPPAVPEDPGSTSRRVARALGRLLAASDGALLRDLGYWRRQMAQAAAKARTAALIAAAAAPPPTTPATPPTSVAAPATTPDGPATTPADPPAAGSEASAPTPAAVATVSSATSTPTSTTASSAATLGVFADGFLRLLETLPIRDPGRLPPAVARAHAPAPDGPDAPTAPPEPPAPPRPVGPDPALLPAAVPQVRRRAAVDPTAGRPGPGVLVPPTPSPGAISAVAHALSVRATVTGTDAVPAPARVQGFAADVAVLRRLPFGYLVPVADQLPDESMRLFAVDTDFLGSVVAGACELGGSTSVDAAAADGQAARLLAALDGPTPPGPGRARFGFLLRSALVVGWPKLTVLAFSTAPTDPADAATGVTLAPVRLDRLSSSILLGLYDRTPAALWIQEPPVGLRYGVDVDASGAVTIPAGPDLPAAVTVPTRDTGADLVIDVGKLAGSLAAATGKATSSGTLAAYLRRPPARQEFLLTEAPAR